jgi:hypothetical protein
VFEIACFDQAMNRDLRNVIARKRAVVLDALYARALFRENRCKPCQPSGPIADVCREPAQTAIRGEATFDDSPEHIRVDVSATEREHDSFCAELG